MAKKKNEDDKIEEEPFELLNEIDEYPQGIGGHKYLVRLEDQSIDVLYKMVRNYNPNSTDSRAHQHVVAAVKTMLNITKKDRQEAVNTMDAYQEQLVALASFITTTFLPALGINIRNSLRKRVKEVEQNIKVLNGESEEIKTLWIAEIDRFLRGFGFKKFELIFARALSEDLRTQQAFDIAKDLVETFSKEQRIEVEDDGVLRIKEAIQNRVQRRNR